MKQRILSYLSRTNYSRMPSSDRYENRPSTPESASSQNMIDRDIRYSNFCYIIDEIIEKARNLKLVSNSLFENFESDDPNQNKIKLLYNSFQKLEIFLKDFIETEMRQNKSKTILEDSFSNLIANLESNLDNMERICTPKIHEDTIFYGTGKSPGFGVMIYKKNEFYVGNWVNNQKHGSGVYIWEDGAVFIGKFEDNKIHKGCIMYANNDTYEGDFNNCKRNGCGTYFFKSGRNPEKGDWKDGIRSK